MAAPYLNLAAAPTEDHELYQPTATVREQAHIKSIEQYHQMYEQSINDPEAFWTPIAKQFHWEEPWTTLHASNFDRNAGPVSIKWFDGAKTNICYNCLDRHVLNGHGDRVAFFWEGNEPADARTVTYSQMLERVQRFANVLKALGIKKGDTVAIYMPMIVDLVVAMLACARIGAPHSIIFGGFSAEALSERIMDARSSVLVTADGAFRGTKFIDLKSIADTAMEKCKTRGFEVTHCVVSLNSGDKAPHSVNMVQGRDQFFHELEATAELECPALWVDAEDILFLLYTSGSTGRPKGVVHTHGGYMVWTATTFKYTFDYHPSDVYFCTADIGWITGHSYIAYGPLLNCATSVMFEGIPTYPEADRYWAIVEKYKVNSFYTAPTAIRSLQRFGEEMPKRHDLSSLRVLGSVGEPINPEAWIWYHDVIGNKRASVVDTYWQTETGGHVITPLPGCTPMKPGSASLPMFGIVPAILDKAGEELSGKAEGYLVIKQSWPGQMRTVFGNHERFELTYFSQFSGAYCTGDGAHRDEHGYSWITGRTDDVITVSGHRMGTAELESAMTTHPDVAESAIVGVPHEIKGEGIHAYVITNPGVETDVSKEKELKMHIRQEIGAFATPDVIHFTSGLPKTRSGKIMRRILRKIAHYEEDSLGDISTLADPSVVQELIDSRPKLQ